MQVMILCHLYQGPPLNEKESALAFLASNLTSILCLVLRTGIFSQLSECGGAESHDQDKHFHLLSDTITKLRIPTMGRDFRNGLSKIAP